MVDLLIDDALAASLTAERDRAKVAALSSSAALAAAESSLKEAKDDVKRAEDARNAAWGILRRINSALNSLGAHPDGQHYPTLPENIVRLEIERYPEPLSADSGPTKEDS